MPVIGWLQYADHQVAPIWRSVTFVISDLQIGLGLVEESPQRAALVWAQLEEGTHVADGNDQGMPRRHGVRIPNDDAVLVASNDARSRQLAERASHFEPDRSIDEGRNTVRMTLRIP
jgi:hypothetical protein